MKGEDEQSEPLLPITSSNCDEENHQQSWKVLSTASDYIPSFAGIRGVAVLLAHYSHIGRWGRNDAHINNCVARTGVGMFFVLSGFLITGNLLKMQEANRAQSGKLYSHLPRFYMDRFVRLYPALILMVVFTAVVRHLHFNGNPPDIAMGVNVFLALSGQSDLFFLFPVQHFLYGNTWSLGVEEHFYIFWALLLPFVSRSNVWLKRTIMFALIAVSLGLSTATYLRNSQWPFIWFALQGPLPNVWKMLLGSSLRLFPTPTWIKRPFVSWLGLAIISLSIAASYWDPAVSIKPGWQIAKLTSRQDISLEVFWEPTMALATIMILCSCAKHGNWLLETNFLQFVGRISYSFYLYQYPILFLAGADSFLLGLAVTSLAFCCALISTLYVEEPIRRWYRAYKATC
jgi:peptidoglycan/LPS O-acetylase OafA/YrhL